MTSRVQTLRSSTTRNVPATGTRQPGELWTNFPDLQIGVIDASQVAQKLVAVRYFSTTANYAAGEIVVQAGAIWIANGPITAGVFNASQWIKVASASDITGSYLPLTGGTLTGALILAADPGAALGAATKQYVDGKVTAAPFLPLAGGTLTGKLTLSGPPTNALDAATKAYADSGAFVPITGGTMTGDLILNRDAQVPLGAATLEQVNARGAGDNRIINGDMRIDQRNNGASGTAGGPGTFPVDRWKYFCTTTARGSWGRNLNAIAGPSGFPYYLGFQSSSAYTSAAGDNIQINQPLEADMISDFAWGTPSAQSVTLSFWTYSSLTGTFGGSLVNYAGTRSYPFTFSLPAASTWTKIVIAIPGDTAGTWVSSGNAGSLALTFDLGCGSTFRGSASVWASANYFGATGAVSIVGTNGATFYVTGVKLEIGSVATPFNRQSLAKSLADCQRYYQTGNTMCLGWCGGAGAQVGGGDFAYPVVMRAAPTLTPNWTTTNNGTGTLSALSVAYIQAFAVGTATGVVNVQSTFTASAEL